MTQYNFHDVPQAMYEQLAEIFGEHDGSGVGAPDTFWVTIGAGRETLTVFAPSALREQRMSEQV